MQEDQQYQSHIQINYQNGCLGLYRMNFNTRKKHFSPQN